MTLLSGENVSRRISESRPGSGKEAKESKGKKEGKEESGGKKQFRLHYCILNPNLIQKRTNTKKPRSVSASGPLLRRRLPTLPLAQYHRRDEA